MEELMPQYVHREKLGLDFEVRLHLNIYIAKKLCACVVLCKMPLVGQK